MILSPEMIIDLCSIYALPNHEANESIVRGLLELGLIDPESTMRKLKLSDKGEAMVNFLTDTPLPVFMWVDPRERIGL